MATYGPDLMRPDYHLVAVRQRGVSVIHLAYVSGNKVIHTSTPDGDRYEVGWPVGALCNRQLGGIGRIDIMPPPKGAPLLGATCRACIRRARASGLS